MRTGITISLETGSSAKKKNTSAHTKGRVGFLRLFFAVGGLVVAVILFSGWNVSLGSLRTASLSHYSFKEVWNVCVNGELTERRADTLFACSPLAQLLLQTPRYGSVFWVVSSRERRHPRALTAHCDLLAVTG